MTDQIKSTLLRTFGMGMLLVLLADPQSVSAADSQASHGAGADNALVSADTVQRDPFWPVGYTPEWVVSKGKEEQGKALKGSGKTDWNQAMKKVEIQGVSSRAAGAEFFAVINDQVKSVGETVAVQGDGILYTWMIDSISPPSSVKLRRISAQ